MLHHIDIYVSDLKASSAFWGWFLESLGYKKFDEWKKGVSWKFKGTYINFVQVEDKYKDSKYHRCQVGLNHLAFHAKSKKHVDELTTELKKRGTRILYEDRHPYAGGKDYYAVFFEDPDRIKVELAWGTV